LSGLSDPDVKVTVTQAESKIGTAVVRFDYRGIIKTYRVEFGPTLAGDSDRQPNAPVSFTAEQDYRNMMDQLGIKSLRPGPSGNESAPNHANYDFYSGYNYYFWKRKHLIAKLPK